MICVGIDVAKDKHDCFILSSDGEVLVDVFTIANNKDGFETLLQQIHCRFYFSYVIGTTFFKSDVSITGKWNPPI